MQMPLIPTSWGELLDKITILEIKASKIKNKAALKNIQSELDLLNTIKHDLPLRDQTLIPLLKELSNVNHILWDIEDRIREKEQQLEFDADFILLARSVYKENDKRAKLKRQINDYLGSELVEEKSYSEY